MISINLELLQYINISRLISQINSITVLIEQLNKNMMNLIKPRHLSLLKKANKQEQPPKKKEQLNTQSSSPPKSLTYHFKRLHRNATRTKVIQYLEYRSQRLKTISQPSLWLISKTYMKRLEARSSSLDPQPETVTARRKVSWSEEAEFVYFSQRKNSASISEASRHRYAIDQ